MSTSVDIKQLAVERGTVPATVKKRRGPLFSRYVIPGVLLVGFAMLIAWAAQDALWPAQRVWVIPALASQSIAQSEGTPLFQAAGWIEPRPSLIRVAALSQGVVKKLLVVQDQPVKTGEPIAELFKEDAQLAYDSAQANLSLREAELQETQASLKAAQVRFEQPVHLQAALSEAESSLGEVTTELKSVPFKIRRAEAEVAYTQANYEGKLASQGAVSGRVIDEARSLLDKAQAALEELKSRTDSLILQQSALMSRRDALQKQLELRTDEIQAKEKAAANIAAALARVDQAKVELAQAKLRLDRMTVRSPVDGRVYQLAAFPGSTLTGGMGLLENVDGSTVVTLYQPQSLQVRVDVRFEDIPKVALNQPVTINNPALAAPLSGKVLFVSSEANIQKNTLQVKVEMDSAGSVLKPEMLVDVTFLAPKTLESAAKSVDKTRLYLPERLIQRDEAGAFVWLVDQSEGVARKTVITTGGSLPGQLIEITEGLPIGSRVIARGYEDLEDGERIQIVSEETQLGTATPTVENLPKEGT